MASRANWFLRWAGRHRGWLLPFLSGGAIAVCAGTLLIMGAMSEAIDQLNWEAAVNSRPLVDVKPADPDTLLAMPTAARIAAAPEVHPVPAVDDADVYGEAQFIVHVILFSAVTIAALVAGVGVATLLAAWMDDQARTPIRYGRWRPRSFRAFVAEAGIVGLAGTLVGLAGARAMIPALNDLFIDHLGGVGLWLLTPRLTVAVGVFSTLLGCGAGLVPAWQLRRAAVVQALPAPERPEG